MNDEAKFYSIRLLIIFNPFFRLINRSNFHLNRNSNRTESRTKEILNLHKNIKFLKISSISPFTRNHPLFPR